MSVFVRVMRCCRRLLGVFLILVRFAVEQKRSHHDDLTDRMPGCQTIKAFVDVFQLDVITHQLVYRQHAFAVQVDIAKKRSLTSIMSNLQLLAHADCSLDKRERPSAGDPTLD